MKGSGTSGPRGASPLEPSEQPANKAATKSRAGRPTGAGAGMAGTPRMATEGPARALQPCGGLAARSSAATPAKRAAGTTAVRRLELLAQQALLARLGGPQVQQLDAARVLLRVGVVVQVERLHRHAARLGKAVGGLQVGARDADLPEALQELQVAARRVVGRD